jgi:hypothetical protein
MTKTALPDVVFTLAGARDPFASGDPYLWALMDLPPKERKMVVRQVVLLCAAIEGLDPLGALELISAVAPYLKEVER